MIPRLVHSYAYCDRLARREAGNFYHAFRVLPRDQRRAMCALYAFLRVADDISDGPGTAEAKRRALTQWRAKLDAALAGHYTHRLHAAIHHTVAHFQIPRQYLDEALDGVAMDLAPVVYATFNDLYGYCYRVASVVGLCCIHIWGFDRNEAKVYAENAGIGFQLTNILRDLGEDAVRGRVYLPREDLERFGYTAEKISQGDRDESFRALMRFEIERARQYYDAAKPLFDLLPPPGRAVFFVMANTYQSLLDAIVRCDYDVFTTRVTVSRWRKMSFVARALPTRLGWT